MKKTILIMLALVLVASLVFASGSEERSEIRESGKGLEWNESERVAMLENRTERAEARIGEEIDRQAERVKRFEGVMERARAKFENESVSNRTMERFEKAANFGSCVSDIVQIRNDCYNESKSMLKACNEAAGQNSTLMRQCLKESKLDLRACQDGFKKAKSAQCGQIKANFLEKIRNFWR